MNDIIITNPHDLRNMLGELIEEKLNTFSHWFETKIIEKEIILSRKQTAEYLNISLGTLHTWTKKGLIKSHGIGDKVFYKMSDIKIALLEIK